MTATNDWPTDKTDKQTERKKERNKERKKEREREQKKERKIKKEPACLLPRRFLHTPFITSTIQFLQLWVNWK